MAVSCRGLPYVFIVIRSIGDRVKFGVNARLGSAMLTEKFTYLRSLIIFIFALSC